MNIYKIIRDYNIIRTNKINKNKLLGGNKKITIKADTIELNYLYIYQDNDEFIYLSDIKNTTNQENNCIIISITNNKSKNNKTAEIINLTSDENTKCYNDDEFIIKNPGSFYLKMTIKMLIKYKEYFNINSIKLKDNSVLYCKNTKIDLSKYLFLTRGYTFYGKYGFIFENENDNIKENRNKKILSKLFVKDINFNEIIKKSLKNKITKEKTHEEKEIINNFLVLVNNNKNKKYIDFMSNIFVKNNINSCLLYSIFYHELEKFLEDNYNYYKYNYNQIRILNI